MSDAAIILRPQPATTKIANVEKYAKNKLELRIAAVKPAVQTVERILCFSIAL